MVEVGGDSGHSFVGLGNLYLSCLLAVSVKQENRYGDTNLSFSASVLVLVKLTRDNYTEMKATKLSTRNYQRHRHYVTVRGNCSGKWNRF